jgi:hypothetical protein
VVGLFFERRFQLLNLFFIGLLQQFQNHSVYGFPFLFVFHIPPSFPSQRLQFLDEVKMTSLMDQAVFSGQTLQLRTTVCDKSFEAFAIFFSKAIKGPLPPEQGFITFHHYRLHHRRPFGPDRAQEDEVNGVASFVGIDRDIVTNRDEGTLWYPLFGE